MWDWSWTQYIPNTCPCIAFFNDTNTEYWSCHYPVSNYLDLFHVSAMPCFVNNIPQHVFLKQVLLLYTFKIKTTGAQSWKIVILLFHLQLVSVLHVLQRCISTDTWCWYPHLRNNIFNSRFFSVPSACVLRGLSVFVVRAGADMSAVSLHRGGGSPLLERWNHLGPLPGLLSRTVTVASKTF